ncbi:MAG: 3-oxoacyl-ACP reductase [Planctomycetota bacterium]|nr:MAG: 3-oxoacyl-ACP reductase [Planctomycetota bacterium]
MTAEPSIAESGELAGLTAVVTGSSSGIGRAIAIELASAGANCLVHGNRNRTGADETAAAIAAFGVAVRVELADIADRDECRRLAEAAWQWRGGIDIWINNAGADVLTTAASQATADEKLELLWRVDVAGTFQLSRAVGARMKQRGRGVIVNVGWDQAETGMEGDAGQIFGTTKAAVMAFTRSLAKSLAPEVRALCVAPGWIKTAWGDAASDYWQGRAKRESLAGRWGTPQDVARVVHFLASPKNDYLNGQTIAVNGGLAK